MAITSPVDATGRLDPGVTVDNSMAHGLDYAHSLDLGDRRGLVEPPGLGRKLPVGQQLVVVPSGRSFRLLIDHKHARPSSR